MDILSACRSFTRNKERIQKFERTSYTRYIYKNQLDKACFQLEMAYGDFKDLARGTVSDKVLRDKAFNIVKNSKYNGYQRGVASMVYKSFDKKVVLIMKLNKLNNWLKNCKNKLLENLKRNSLFFI